jgi:surface-anchored protein
MKFFGPAWISVALVALTFFSAAPPAQATLDETESLKQKIAAGQEIDGQEAVIEDGHVDIGPRFIDGQWTLMIHDDREGSGTGESVWRNLDRTVLKVNDAALETVPDDPEYSFIPSDPGEDVFVVPQTQNPEVVWLGWNTQDPETMASVDRGVTLRMTGVEGPGELVAYLQSGDFAQPDVLWNSQREPSPVWVDVNTHSHANWVFTEPGVYLIQVEVAADLVDGTSVRDVRELRVAIGSATPTEAAFAAEWSGPVPVAMSEDEGIESEPGADDGGNSGLWVAVAAVAVLLGVVLVLVLVRGRRAKRLARGVAADSKIDDGE